MFASIKISLQYFLLGVLLLVSKLFDAVVDPFIGKASDRTRSRWGRRRPWLLFASIPQAFFYFLLWMVPHFTLTGKIAYYLIVLCSLNLCYTMVAVPYVAMTPELAVTYHDRTTLTGYKSAFLISTMVVVSVLHAFLIGAFDTMEPGYIISAAIVSFVLIAAPWTVFFNTNERKDFQSEDSRRIGYFEGMRIAFSNRPFLLVSALYVLDWCAVQLVQNNLLLYVTYVLKRPDLFTVVIIVIQISTLIWIPIWAQLTRRVGKRYAYMLGALVFSLVTLAMYALKQFKWYTVYPLCFFAGAGVSAAFVIPWSMIPDVVDLDELHSGQRREGVFYGLFVFLMKSGIAIALALAGFSLERAGYISGTHEKEQSPVPQPESVVKTLKELVGIGPAVLLACSLIPAFFYPITKDLQSQTQVQLTALRAAAKERRETASIILPREDAKNEL
jgi:GPH family glycoside/pentoside/hexuronide:cation symporter